MIGILSVWNFGKDLLINIDFFSLDYLINESGIKFNDKAIPSQPLI